ncbi:MAG: glycosyltransferase family 2 protein [Burkholderiales bacterium]
MLMVYVIILNYNGRCWLPRCLSTLAETRYENFRIVVVDNASSDDSLKIVSEGFPSVEVIANGANLGFSEGNNVGIRAALENGADYVVLLNPDTKVEPGWLGALIAAGESDARIGILGAVQFEYEGDDFNDWTKTAAREHLDELRRLESARSYIPMAWVEGACIAVKRSVLEEVGLLDPIFFAFYEEIDLCRRAICQEYKVVLVPRSRIRHYRGGSWLAEARIARERDYRCDRSQFIYSATDPRSSLAGNFYQYLITLGTKIKDLTRSFSWERASDLAKMQMDLLRSCPAILGKWRHDRSRLIWK